MAVGESLTAVVADDSALVRSGLVGLLRTAGVDGADGGVAVHDPI